MFGEHSARLSLLLFCKRDCPAFLSEIEHKGKLVIVEEDRIDKDIQKPPLALPVCVVQIPELFQEERDVIPR